MGIKRYRSWLTATSLLTHLVMIGAYAQDNGDGSLLLVNGRIHTLAADNSIVNSVLIDEGRIVAVGDDLQASSADTEVIDLDGRMAIPGLIDSHVHFIRAGLRPGYDMRGIESARSISELQSAVSARAAEVPDGAFVTGVGGWNPVQ
jgi:predicted amidohydrolase YtcJ